MRTLILLLLCALIFYGIGRHDGRQIERQKLAEETIRRAPPPGGAFDYPEMDEDYYNSNKKKENQTFAGLLKEIFVSAFDSDSDE